MWCGVDWTLFGFVLDICFSVFVIVLAGWLCDCVYASGCLMVAWLRVSGWVWSY